MNFSHPLVQKSRALTRDLRFSEAFSLIDSAIQSGESDPELGLEFGRLLCYLQREDEALTWLERGSGSAGFEELANLLGQYIWNRRAMAEKLGVADHNGTELFNRYQAIQPIEFSPRIRLTAALIVKNEEQFLAQCLDAMNGKVDEIVVVDTGSTDRTVEIATEFGAKVSEFAWVNDFSAARNASLEQASGDWILWIDADEIVAENSWNAIHEALIRSHFGGYFLTIVNFTDEGEKSTYTHAPVRLFQRHDAIRFEGTIHEQVAPSIDRLGLPCAQLNGATILHYGYKPSIMQDRDKMNRTISMLQAQIEAEPNEAFHWFNLANAYSVEGSHEEVIPAAKKCLELMEPGNSFGSLTYQLLASSLTAMGRVDESLSTASEARDRGYFTILNQFELAHALYRNRQFGPALETIEQCLEMAWPEGMTGDKGIVTHKSHVLQAQILTEMGRLPKALEIIDKALEVDPNFGLAHFAKGVILERIGKLSEAAAEFSISAEDASYGVPCLVAGARVTGQLGDAHLATSMLEKAWRRAPSSGEIWSLWAESAQALGDPQLMLNCYEAYATCFEPNVSVWVNWARALQTLGRANDARAKYEELSTWAANDANMWLNYGDFVYQQGEFANAAACYESALKIDPENAEAWFVLGNSFANLGLFSGAVVSYQQTLRIDPNHSKAVHNLSMVEGSAA